MPKIKIKNIPFKTQERVCTGNLCNSQCPFYTDDATIVNDFTFTIEHITCLRDTRYDPKEAIIELPEKYFPTNREWLESLSDEDLASVMACKPFPVYSCLYGVTVSMIKDWLSKPCEYLMEVE